MVESRSQIGLSWPRHRLGTVWRLDPRAHCSFPALHVAQYCRSLLGSARHHYYVQHHDDAEVAMPHRACSEQARDRDHSSSRPRAPAPATHANAIRTRGRSQRARRTSVACSSATASDLSRLSSVVTMTITIQSVICDLVLVLSRTSIRLSVSRICTTSTTVLLVGELAS